MPDPTPDIDYVDYTSVRFPSDRLTFGALRTAHPDLFDVDGAENFFDAPRTATAVGDIFYLERLLARHAYEVALGKADDVLRRRHLDREDCLAELTAAYAKYGLASGRSHTEQLVRDFETQAVAQAPGRAGHG